MPILEVLLVNKNSFLSSLPFSYLDNISRIDKTPVDDLLENGDSCPALRLKMKRPKNGQR